MFSILQKDTNSINNVALYSVFKAYNKFQDKNYNYHGELDGLLTWFRLDNQNRYSLPEYLQIMCSQIKNSRIRDEAYRKFMHGTDGYIHAEDILLTMNSLFEANITIEDAEKLIEKGNPSGEKKLDFADFAVLMQWE